MNMNMVRILCGISGLMRILRYMVRKKWQHLNAILSQIKKYRLKEKTIIID